MPIDTSLPQDSTEELFEQAPCGYLQALPNGTLVKVNRTFLTWTAYERDALLGGRTFQQLLTIPGRIYFETHVAPLLQMQGFVSEIAFDVRRADGTVLPVILNCMQKKDAAGRAVLLRITVFDATDRRQYERELLAARRSAEQANLAERDLREEAERASRAKDDILALVSHELRTPLSAILGWTQILQRKMAGNPEIEHGLGVIERNTRLQTRLVDDLLDMSRIASGKLRLNVQRVHLAEVIEAALESARPAAEARRLRLQKVLDPAVIVSGDPGRLQQVFWNLFSNAVKFTPADGLLRVVMQRVDSHIEVRTIDTGQGMDAKLIDHVFERFRQSDSVGTRETRGLGLGLSIVKHLIEMHGGTIQAHSEGLGQGSTFTVQLPVLTVQRQDGAAQAAAQTAVLAQPPPDPHVSLSGITVLLADDDRDARELLCQVLSGQGAQVLAASSAAEALHAVEHSRPDVLISDIEMPGEDGYELIRKVRMLGEGAGAIPALALTALSRLEDRTRALLAGYQIHLAKPVDAGELIVTVASLAGRLGTSPKHSHPGGS
ncbi:MAG TPA: hybrid sensor histidine kinase/response regulator [Steroidobacteraceae bacterium]